MSNDRFYKRHQQCAVPRNIVSDINHKVGRNMEVDMGEANMRYRCDAGPQQ